MRPKISRIEVWSGRPEPAVDVRADADVAEDEAVHGREAPAHVLLDVLPALALARRELVAEARLEERRGLVVEGRARVAAPPVWKSNIQPDFNVRVIERFVPDSSAVLRELDESNRFVQKSAESTSI